MNKIIFSSFELWRQDDNGLCFLVGRYPTCEAAEERLAGLTRGQHKQTYWIAKTASHAEQVKPACS
jgi:hypothetical protein